MRFRSFFNQCALLFSIIFALSGCALLRNEEERFPATKEVTVSTLDKISQTYETTGLHNACQGTCFVNFVDLINRRSGAFDNTPRDTTATFSLSAQNTEHLVLKSYRGEKLVEELTLQGYVNQQGYFDLPLIRSTTGNPPWRWSRDYRDMAVGVLASDELILELRTGGTAFYLFWPFYGYGDTRTYTFRPVHGKR